MLTGRTSFQTELDLCYFIDEKRKTMQKRQNIPKLFLSRKWVGRIEGTDRWRQIWKIPISKQETKPQFHISSF